MTRKRKLSRTTLEVLGVFVEDPTRERHGYELMQLAGISSGSLYPILQRLEDEGWVDASVEDVDPSAVGRPRRRNYRITGLGIEVYRAELAALLRPTSAHLNPGWAR